MAAVGTARYGDLCRLCLTKTNMGSGLNIFESQIKKRIDICLPIQVYESDDLPKVICENCVYKLDLFFDFRERSLQTEGILIGILKEITNKLASCNELMKVTQNTDISTIEQSCMITIHSPHNSMLPDINEIEFSHLQHRDIISHHDLILNHQAVDINGHSHLTNSGLNGSDLSNQTVLVNGVPYAVDNLQLIQHQNFLLQQELNLNIINEDTVCTNGSASPNRHIDENQLTDVIIKQDHVKLEHNSFKKEFFVDNQCQSEITDHPLEDFGGYNSDETQMILNNQKKSDENGSTTLYNNQNHANNSDWIHCNMCNSTFMDKNEFELHYEQHFNKCLTCLAVLPSNEDLCRHMKEAHGTDIEDSNDKDIKVKTKKELAPTLNEDDQPIIDDSNSESEGGGNIDTAVEDEEDEDDLETDAGESVTIKKKKWSPKECKECGKLYKTNYKLVEHMRKHTGEKPYKCNSCEKAFRSKIGLAQHEAKHTGQYDLSCPICGKGFQCKSYLMVHQRVHSDIKPYPCTTCGRNFKTKQSLLDHTNRHLGVKPYICDVCGRGFITKGLCKAHQKVHTGLDNRKYSCKVCHKMFVSKSYLQTHLRIHTGEKPFICEVCGKGFLTRVDLRIHSTMHTGEKSFVCEMCGKAFARRDALRCHRRSHTGERPYSCDQCGQTFTQFSPMAIHKRLHTGERPYSCEVCGKSFVSRSTMMSHFKKHGR